MKIAIVSETFLPQVNGIVRTLERLIKHLEKKGHEVLLITLGDGDARYSESTVVRVPGVKFMLYPELHLVRPEEPWLERLVENPLTQIPISMLQALLPMPNRLVGDSLKLFEPDVVHLVTPASLGAVGYYYVDKLKIPSISTYHTDIASYTSKYQLPYAEHIVNVMTKIIYERTDRVFAPSPSSQKQLYDCGLEDVGVFGRGVDSEMFRNKNNLSSDEIKKIKTDLGLDPELKTIMYAGRLAEEKSIPVLVDDFKKLKRGDTQLLLVGDGPIRKKLEKELRGTKHVFTGMLHGEDYARTFNAADVFAFPSQTETFGQVVLEAMASALPVIGFDSPGVRDLIEDQVTGLLLNEDSMQTALDTLLDDVGLAKKYGEAAFNYAQTKSWTAILDEFAAEYQALIAP